MDELEALKQLPKLEWVPLNYHDGLREAARLIKQNGNVGDALIEIGEALQKPIPKVLSDFLVMMHRKDPK